MKYLKRIKVVLHLIGSRNWHQGVDKPNFYQWIYRWRIGFDTAWKISKIAYK